MTISEKQAFQSAINNAAAEKARADKLQAALYAITSGYHKGMDRLGMAAIAAEALIATSKGKE